MYWEPTLATYPLSVEEDGAEALPARLTMRGVQKLAGGGTHLLPGTDYKVKDGGVDWIACPDHGSTKHFRNTWILVRRKRPRVPAFFGAPVPRHAQGEHDRAALIVLSYFHPWTLRANDADRHVQYAGVLRGPNESWQDALRTLLEGNIVCREAQRFVRKCLAVHRMRPRDEDEADCNRDDVVSDEELEVSRIALVDALATRIGGKEGPDREVLEGGPTHFENSTAVVQLNQDIWGYSLENDNAKVPTFTGPNALEQILAAAK